jgi:hypothetical protein
MRLALRYCQHCRAKALTPKSRGRTRMRVGHVYRKNHDLCGRCFREAASRAVRAMRGARWDLVA